MPFDRWEDLIAYGKGAIVWASDAYEKTGIEPYVHERGVRVPSLRRLYKKRPYFTNGSAQNLADVVRAARFDGSRFEHRAQALGEGARSEHFDESTVAAIVAFIDLL